MQARTIINFTRPVLLGLFLMTVGAAPGRAEVRKLEPDGARWVQVSINAGETYVIENIKPGTRPSFHVEQNPNALDRKSVV